MKKLLALSLLACASPASLGAQADSLSRLTAQLPPRADQKSTGN